MIKIKNLNDFYGLQTDKKKTLEQVKERESKGKKKTC